MPLVSICIPTYNRAQHLRDTLESIVSQDAFREGDLVEVVVSDNCSSDATEQIARQYADRFPGKVLYHKTSRNIGFDNFREVLSIAHGRFRKLNNDTLQHNGNALERIISLVKACECRRDILFFANGILKNVPDDVVCGNADDFLKTVSYYNTWIGSYGLWDTDLADAMRIFAAARDSQIPQTHELLGSIVKGRSVRVCNKQIFRSIAPAGKGGYNIAEVFGYNYLSLLRRLVDQGALSKVSYEKEKRKLIKFVNKFYFDIEGDYAFDKTGYFKWVAPFYRRNLYFWWHLVLVAGRIAVRRGIHNIIRKESDGKIRTIVLFSRYRVFSYVSKRWRKGMHQH